MPSLMDVFSACTRGVLTASPGHELFVGDFSAIEAMTLAWLAGQESALEIFRRKEDIYCDEAAGIFQRPVSKKNKYERSVGKVAVLAFGYQGGIRACATFSRAYSVDLTPAYYPLWESASDRERDLADLAYQGYVKRAGKMGDDILPKLPGLAADIIKQRWRAKNDKIARYWYDVEDAAIKAVRTGEKVTVGGRTTPAIIYGMWREHLVCKLPGGSNIVYPFVHLAQTETPWGEPKTSLTYKAQNEDNYQYDRTYTYGGKEVENITQGVARDLLADALLRLDAADFNLCLHCHDEAVSDEIIGTKSIAEFERVMAEVPPWAKGLPIQVECWKGQRYRK